MLNKKKIALLIPVVSVLIISFLLIFDVNSRIDILLNPEKYSFNLNLASKMTKEDYYISKNNLPSLTVESEYNELIKIQKKYQDQNDDIGQKITSIIDKLFDQYHDLISTKKSSCRNFQISNEDLKWLFTQKQGFLIARICHFPIWFPILENNKTLLEEAKYRKMAISIIKKDAKERGIKTKVKNIDFKIYIVDPAYFDMDILDKKLFDEIINASNIYNNKEDYTKITAKINKHKEYNNEIISDIISLSKQQRNKYWNTIENLNISLRHRYIITLEEKTKNNVVKHYYEIHPYKEGSRIYWDYTYYPPNSEYIKAYLEMLKLSMNF